MKSKLAQVIKGLAALVVVTGLVVGVPWALWHFVGWPLPHHVPSAAQVGRALNRQGIPAQALVDALAVVVWLTWATLLASLAVEIPAALSGRHAPRLPIAGAFQPLTGQLVAAIIVACLLLAPRPAHPGTPSAPGGPAGLVARRPVAALVVHDATLTASVTPSPPAPAAAATPSPSAGAPTTPAPEASSAVPTTYVVQRGDTLWGIAQRELGDPLRWSEIFQLNEGRLQPGGVTLTDPHWIDPGWTLLLPPTATAPVPAPTPTAPTVPSTAPAPAPAATLPSTTVPTAPPPSRAVPPTTVPTRSTPGDTGVSTPSRSPDSATSARPAPHDQRQPVQLPSGSVVAASFAAGVAATIAIGRLRRRHTYRYRPPQPGRTRVTEPLRPTVAHMRRAATEDRPPLADKGPFPPMPVEDEERRQDPGRLDIGTRQADTVTVELTDLNGVALDGPAADEIARALAAGLVIRAGPGAAEVLCAEDTAGRLLPGLPSNRSIRRTASADLVARAVESERVARARRFAGVDAADAEQFRSENPENPLPLLFVLLDDLPDDALGRWVALLADAARFAIAILFLTSTPIATATLHVNAGRRVTDAEPAERLGSFVGAEMFGLRADEATEVLAAITEAAEVGDVDEDGAAITQVLDGLAEEPWPEPALDRAAPPDGARPPDRPARVGGEVDRPINVHMFGHLEVAVCGEPVVIGLRGRARDLLAWCLMRPEGATSDEAVDALWPDTSPGRVHGQFWRSFSDLRARLREVGGADLEVFTKAGEHYQPNGAEIACDLWDFQSALGAASRTDNPEQACMMLRRAVEVYRGDLMAGTDYSWVEPVRQDLHRRALDAHLRLAELEERAGRGDAAVEVLERAIDRDRYAEEPYRRLMRHHAAHDRPDAVGEVWRLLQGRLSELDLDVESATAALYRQLTAPQAANPPRSRS